MKNDLPEDIRRWTYQQLCDQHSRLKRQVSDLHSALRMLAEESARRGKPLPKMEKEQRRAVALKFSKIRQRLDTEEGRCPPQS